MTKKTKDLTPQELNVQELTNQLEKNKQDLFKLKFRTATAPVKNVMQIRYLRREIARLHTFIKQKGSSPK